MEVGAGFFAGLHRRDTHDGIAEPVARSQENTERGEIFADLVRREVEATFAPSPEETWQRGFPAIVNPEPVGR